MGVPREVKRQADEANAIQAHLTGKPPQEGLNGGSDPQPDNEPVDWEKRFKNLKKSHDETIPELRETIDKLQADNVELKALIDKATPDTPAVQADPQFTPEEIEEYGEDFLNMVTRVAKSIAGGGQDVVTELKELKNQFNGITQNLVKSEEEKFYDALDKAVPDWETINDDDEFHSWLAEEMPMTGRQRQYFLAEAQKKFNAPKVIEFFTAWKGQSGKVSYLPDSHPSGSNEELREEEIPFFTKAEVKKFYEDKKLGRYKNREDEARQIEMKIFRAQNAGRIR